jgi:hypothetical protein
MLSESVPFITIAPTDVATFKVTLIPFTAPETLNLPVGMQEDLPPVNEVISISPDKSEPV